MKYWVVSNLNRVFIARYFSLDFIMFPGGNGAADERICLNYQ
jgi:hypothetical protein